MHRHAVVSNPVLGLALDIVGSKRAQCLEINLAVVPLVDCEIRCQRQRNTRNKGMLCERSCYVQVCIKGVTSWTQYFKLTVSE